jgi:hypothetical protein
MQIQESLVGIVTRVIVMDEFGGTCEFLCPVWRYYLSICLEGLRNATNPVRIVGLDLELTRDSDMMQEFQVYHNVWSLRVSQGQYEHCVLVDCDV